MAVLQPQHLQALHLTILYGILHINLAHWVRQRCRAMASESTDPYDLDDEKEDPILPLIRRDPSLEHEETCHRLAKLLREEGDKHVWDGPPKPVAATKKLPGSPGKYRVMKERARKGQQLFHPEDVILADQEALEIAELPRKEGGSRRRANGAQPLGDRREAVQGGQLPPSEKSRIDQELDREVYEWRKKNESSASP